MRPIGRRAHQAQLLGQAVSDALHLGELCGPDPALRRVEDPRQQFGCGVQFVVEAEIQVGKLSLKEPAMHRVAQVLVCGFSPGLSPDVKPRPEGPRC